MEQRITKKNFSTQDMEDSVIESYPLHPKPSGMCLCTKYLVQTDLSTHNNFLVFNVLESKLTRINPNYLTYKSKNPEIKDNFKISDHKRHRTRVSNVHIKIIFVQTTNNDLLCLRKHHKQTKF